MAQRRVLAARVVESRMPWPSSSYLSFQLYRVLCLTGPPDAIQYGTRNLATPSLRSLPCGELRSMPTLGRASHRLSTQAGAQRGQAADTDGGRAPQGRERPPSSGRTTSARSHSTADRSPPPNPQRGVGGAVLLATSATRTRRFDAPARSRYIAAAHYVSGRHRRPLMRRLGARPRRRAGP